MNSFVLQSKRLGNWLDPHSALVAYYALLQLTNNIALLNLNNCYFLRLDQRDLKNVFLYKQRALKKTQWKNIVILQKKLGATSRNNYRLFCFFFRI